MRNALLALVTVALNEEIFFDGRAYRCVEVFGPNEAPRMATPRSGAVR